MNEDTGHLTAEQLEALAEGALDEKETAASRAHLESCRSCAMEMESYEHLFSMLATLPRHAPSHGFADAVMARVRVQPQESLFARWVKWLVPQSRRGWVLLGTAVTAPITPVIALIGLMLMQPLLTPFTLLQWVQFRVQSVVQGFYLWGIEEVSAIASWDLVESAYTAIQALPGGALAAAAAGLTIGIPLSIWTLLRATRTPAARVTYAN